MFEHKKGYVAQSVIKFLDAEESRLKLASPEILERLEKHAKHYQTLAPKSDDFLYFSIIFLKSAESALIDDFGNPKKVGADQAWGYFDDNWAWHGNVKPHKNNNLDIFPEAELRKASRQWIGKPLCVDHKSDTVDGIRGIILDTHYDEKLKQVVGLCALDKINYPDLARKVQTGVVRFGSMGTAVGISVCSECSHKARNPREYCDCILKRSAWGEINIELKPIEYSLVVQPAEPGAKLLRCIASIKSHESELKSFGIDNLESVISSLSEDQADYLDRVLSSVCGESGCSLDQKKKITAAFIDHSQSEKKFSKLAFLTGDQEREVQFAEALAELHAATGKSIEDAPELYSNIFKAFGRSMPTPTGEALTSGQTVNSEPNSPTTIVGGKDSGDVADYTGTAGNTTLTSGETEPGNQDFFGETSVVGGNSGGKGAEPYNYASEDSEKTIKKIAEEIKDMNEARMRKRAELRRRLAYHQGGSAPAVEPKGTYKDQGAENVKIREKQDKQMLLNPKSLGGTDGMAPGDQQVKEKLSRAELEERKMKREAYFQGGSAPAIEPKGTYKDQGAENNKIREKADKHMLVNPKSLGGTDGMVPGDQQIKEKQSRAYDGPALKTKLVQARKLDGSLDKEGSTFEVFAGKEKVISTNAKTIWGSTLNENWDYMTTQDYGKAVVAEIREKGLGFVKNLLTKSAQELPAEMPPMDPAAGGPADLGAAPPPSTDLPPMPDDVGGMEAPMEGEDTQDPKVVLEEAFMAMEEAIEKAKGVIDTVGGEDVDVNVNIGDEGVDAEKLALSAKVFKDLKKVYAEANDLADEIAMLSETYDRTDKLSPQQRTVLAKLSRDSIYDSANVVGECNALVRVAELISSTLVKTSEYQESEPSVETKAVDEKVQETVQTSASEKATDELQAFAIELRRQRREEMLKKAQEKVDALEKKKEEDVSAAEDGKTKEEKDEKDEPKEHKALDSTFSVGSGKDTGWTNKAPTGTDSNSAKDKKSDVPASEVHEIAEDEAEEEVEKHEDKMHEKEKKDKKENDAQDATVVKAKLSETYTAKKAEEEREAYKLKVRRAFDVALEMQKKGFIAPTKPALDRQVDDIMQFDDKAFEAFKRSISSAKAVGANVKVASDLQGVNVGIADDTQVETSGTFLDQLNSMWK